ncbi:hypothetical protein GLX27_001442 [Malassezia furfur]|uniref:Mannosyl phosphorylinositol ceramide synthase SUR1 n=1 Tax=Malassezia furfur TaxID=55194 RepID=A0ABY8EPX9_MALFU|nr:hypothetical protein CBS14141_000891 [Malassezia furfur]WFD46800.1 hypothetical protein GLX27_001442 [Malassezia furfur]
MVLVSRRTSSVLLGCLGLFLLGTVGVLSIVRAYFKVDDIAYIQNTELGTLAEIARGVRPAALTIAPDAQLNATDVPIERIPRIIHQTWKTETLPPRWAKTRAGCAAMMPDYDYMLWTDKSSRELIATDYPWFLPVFDAYPHNIQRADAIRYFVLHKYGGIYMDLDIGCKRRLDSLLRFEAILPKTIPVGVSNDLMFAAKGHPFVKQLTENLGRFNHNFLTPYATVMFSTGPMFVSAVYRMFSDAHPTVMPSTPAQPTQGFRGVRVLPKSLYGKNAKPSEAPDSFFEHMYGSSWHEGDAGFLIFLRKYGRLLMLAGVGVIVLGLRRFYATSLLALGRMFWDALRPVLALLPFLPPDWFAPRSSSGPEWVHLTDREDERLLGGGTPKPVPMFVADEALNTHAHDVPTVVLPKGRPASRTEYSEQDPAALAEHSCRAAQEDTALGSYSKRQESWGAELTRLPAYYVGGASEYAMADTSFGSNEGSEEKAIEPSTRRSFQLTRFRPSWRSLSVGPLKALVPRPLRRNSAPQSDGGDLDNVSVEGGEPLSRTISSQSDEYHREFASLVQGANSDSYLVASPPFGPAGSPPPTVLISQDQAQSHRRSAVVRRQPVNDLSRVMTPAVPPIPPTDYVPGQDRLRAPSGL